MSRIGKPDVHAALDRAAKNIVDARGNDPVISRKDIEEAVKQLSGAEKALTAHFFRYIDARDAKPGARVTAKDVDRALVFAKARIIDKYDLNNNGLSRDEVAKMSYLGRLAVDFARQLRAARLGQATPVEPTPTPPTGLAAAIAAVNKMPDGTALYHMSESDYPYLHVEVPHPGALTSDKIMSAFKQHMLDEVFNFEGFEAHDFNDLTANVYSPAESQSYLTRFGSFFDPLDDYSKDAAAATTALKGVLAANLTDLTVVKVGPKGPDGKLLDDAGLYNYFILGKTADGKLAGVSFGAVET